MIYLDHNATAPLLPEARAAMEPLLGGVRGNASSLHGPGREARRAVEAAREEVAALVGAADPTTIHFTSGGTEADVWALRGAFELESGPPLDCARDRDGLVVTAVEHPAVLETARALGRRGVRLALAGVDRAGRLGPLPVDERTRLVAVMAANNETGNLHDVAGAARVAHAAGALLHTDAVQAIGKIPVDVREWDVDLCALSAHKLGGPQGVGALYVRPGLRLPPLLTGGGQEHGLRSGTENAAGIAGFGAAARIARLRLAAAFPSMARLRDRLEARILAGTPGARVQGEAEGSRRLPNTSSLAFAGVKGEALVIALDAAGVAASTGSACSSGSGKPSHVLVAMGVPEDEIGGALRLSLGPETTEAQVDEAAARVSQLVARLRAIAAG